MNSAPAKTSKLSLQHPENSGPYYPALDGVRGLAILLVILVHTRSAYVMNDFDASIARLLGFGQHGVDIFFVLSGFLITGILLDSKDTPNYFRNFYARRALRIFPLYYVYLLCRLVLLPLLSHKFVLLKGDLSEGQPDSVFVWLYATNFINTRLVSGILHLWSLAVEEQFYLIWPLAVLVSSRKILMRICLTTILIGPVLRAMFLYWGDSSLAYGSTISRADALAAGALISILLRREKGLRDLVRLGNWMMFVGILIPLIYYAVFRDWNLRGAFTLTIGVECFTMFTFGLIIVLLKEPSSIAYKCCTWAPARSLGRYSYCIYVCHFVVLRMCYRLIIPYVHLPIVLGSALVGKIVFVACNVLFSYMLAWVSWHLLERHCLRLKRYFSSDQNAIVLNRKDAAGAGS